MEPLDNMDRLRELMAEAANALQPDRSSLLLAIERMIWRKFLSARPELGDDHQQIKLIAWGWVVHTFRQMHAVARLHRQGLSDAGLANARSAMEHGIYLSLVAAHARPEEVLDKLESGYMRMFDEVVAAGHVPRELFPMVHEIRSEIPSITVPRTTEWTKKIEQICDRFATGDNVYLYYRALSSQVHPGFGTASTVLDALAEEGTLAHPAWEARKPTGLWIALGSAAWAGWSYDKMFHKNSFTKLLDEEVRPLDFVPLTLKTGSGPAPTMF